MRNDLSDEDLRFGTRLKERRTVEHLSRQSVADAARLSEATIKLIETGRTKPTLSTIASLMMVQRLGLMLDDLPLWSRAQVRAMLALPRVSVCAAARSRSHNGLRRCSGAGEHCQNPPESPPSSPSSA